MIFYFRGGHTLASCLRAALEEERADDEFVSCTKLHPLDEFIEVHAPSETRVRTALLRCQKWVSQTRASLL